MRLSARLLGGRGRRIWSRGSRRRGGLGGVEGRAMRGDSEKECLCGRSCMSLMAATGTNMRAGKDNRRQTELTPLLLPASTLRMVFRLRPLRY